MSKGNKRTLQCNDQSGWFPSNYVVESSSGVGYQEQQYNAKLPPSPQTAAQPTGCFSTCLLPKSRTLAVMETVLCLYKFTAQNNEELSFEKGEKLDVIEHPVHDPEWWRAVNSRGESGLVPTNYIQVRDW